MPYKSDAQRKYFNANRGKLEAQGVDVDEWNQASKGKKLPAHLAQGGQIMDKFNSRPRPGKYLRGGPVQAEGRSWAKESKESAPNIWATEDEFRAPPDANKSYGKSGGSLGSGGMHGPNCGCATCRARWGS